MAKIGRPKAKEVQEKIITLRVTPSKHQKIQKYAQTHNLTTTEVLLKGVDMLLDTT